VASTNIPAVSERETMTLTRTVGTSILAVRDNVWINLAIIHTLDDAALMPPPAEECGPSAEYSRRAKRMVNHNFQLVPDHTA
jgi:hypothetical protein